MTVFSKINSGKFVAGSAIVFLGSAMEVMGARCQDYHGMMIQIPNMNNNSTYKAVCDAEANMIMLKSTRPGDNQQKNFGQTLTPENFEATLRSGYYVDSSTTRQAPVVQQAREALPSRRTSQADSWCQQYHGKSLGMGKPNTEKRRYTAFCQEGKMIMIVGHVNITEDFQSLTTQQHGAFTQAETCDLIEKNVINLKADEALCPRQVTKARVESKPTTRQAPVVPQTQTRQAPSSQSNRTSQSSRGTPEAAGTLEAAWCPEYKGQKFQVKGEGKVYVAGCQDDDTLFLVYGTENLGPFDKDAFSESVKEGYFTDASEEEKSVEGRSTKSSDNKADKLKSQKTESRKAGKSSKSSNASEEKVKSVTVQESGPVSCSAACGIVVAVIGCIIGVFVCICLKKANSSARTSSGSGFAGYSTTGENANGNDRSALLKDLDDNSLESAWGEDY